MYARKAAINSSFLLPIKIPISSLLCDLSSHLLNCFHLEDFVFLSSRYPSRHCFMSCLHSILPPATSKISLKGHIPLISTLVPLPPLLHLISKALCKSSLKTLQTRLLFVRLHLPPLLLTLLLPLFLPRPLPPHLLLPKYAVKMPPTYHIPTQNAT